MFHRKRGAGAPMGPPLTFSLRGSVCSWVGLLLLLLQQQLLLLLAPPVGALSLLPPPRAAANSSSLLLPSVSLGAPSLQGTPRWLGALRGGGLFGSSGSSAAAAAAAAKGGPQGGASGGAPFGGPPSGTGSGGNIKRPPNLLTLGAPHSSDVAAVYIHPKRARALQLQPGAPLVLQGRRKRKSVGVLIEDKELKEDEVSVHPRVYAQLKLYEGDLLLIERLDVLPLASRVYVQIFNDSFPFLGAAAATGGGPRGPLDKGGPPGGPQAWEAVLHAIESFFNSRPRPLRVGDQYKIPVYVQGRRGEERSGNNAGGPPLGGAPGGPQGLQEEIEIKIMRIDGENKHDLEFGLVGEQTTKIIGEDGLDREAFDSASEVTYDDLGGLKKEVQLLREYVELPLRFPNVFKQRGS
ncbi:hypothetical protein, conserved [Eimeria acervulina]|uniref:Uncharacterized protein n=1 Tax=Eimeria acervulina TaxID=5801 RepID=U6GFV6_EIMAC|nr:hypothetical protein, conserved [Eimeria acervulina]CDI79116.1 hypothetical protein, conserved [Eimeria acervulina]